MEKKVWDFVDDYLCGLLLEPDPVMDEVLKASREAGLPEINIAPNHGQMLNLLARIRGAKSILEIGTLGGYSTIWLARALPPAGRLITLEADGGRAQVARANLVTAGVDSLVEIRVGDARQTLPQLKEEGAGPFDFIFIDADKPGYPEYLQWSLELSAPGTVIVADNVVRSGAVADNSQDTPLLAGIRRFLDMLAQEPRLAVTAVQTVGSKGYDGFSLAVVRE